MPGACWGVGGSGGQGAGSGAEGAQNKLTHPAGRRQEDFTEGKNSVEDWKYRCVYELIR